MQNIIIDDEFMELLPPLDKETYRLLEENILAHGVLNPLVVWESAEGDILVDGYNRYAICSEHDIPFETVAKEFASRDDVTIWIISNQVARRNLTPEQLSYFRGRHYRSEKAVVTNPDGKNQFKEVGSQNGNQPKNPKTLERLATEYKVSKNTIWRDEQYADAIDAIGRESPEAKRKILMGEASIPKRHLQEIVKSEPHYISELAAKLIEGTYERKQNAHGTGAHDVDLQESSTSQTPVAPHLQPIKLMLSEIAALDASIEKTQGIISSQLQKITKSSEKSKLKEALSSCINRLAKLSESI